jgi:hypothetical protein
MDKEGAWQFHPHVPVAVNAEAEFAASRQLLADFARAFSHSLEHLSLENTSGKWDFSGLCDGLANLKSLALSYIQHDSSMSTKWSGNALESLELCCADNIGFETFFHDADTRSNGKHITNLKLSTSKSSGWTRFNDWVLHFQKSNPNLLEYLSLDGDEVVPISSMSHLFSFLSFPFSH